MTDMTTGFDLMFRWLGRALGGPQSVGRYVSVATLSVAHTLMSLVSQGMASDISRMKESLLKRIEAEADTKAAEAQKRLADAVDAANRANLPKRFDAIARAEKEMARANAAKKNAEGQAILMDAETRRIQAVADAKAKLLDALSRLRQEGGEFLVDTENLKEIIRKSPPFGKFDNWGDDGHQSSDEDAGQQ